MGRATEVTQGASVGASSIIPLSTYGDPGGITWRAIRTAGSGDLTYSIQGTISDLVTYSSAAANWFDLVSGATTNRDGSYVAPLTGIRLLVTAASASAGSTVVMRVLQGGV